MQQHAGPLSSERAEAPALPRRLLGVSLLGAAALSILPASEAQAGFKKELKKKKIPEEDYTVLEANGLRVYDLEEGSGREIAAGDKIVVHFDCIYRGLDVVSSRAARLLGGNRTIAEPYEFIVGEPVSGAQVKYSEGGNSLFSGAAGPAPPQALSKGVIGMKKGGKRSILVDQDELGYPKGVNELPPNTPFELRIEVLQVL